MKDWIGIFGEAIPVAEGLAFVADPAAGEKLALPQEALLMHPAQVAGQGALAV
jgi:hypothetical protein